MNDALSRWVSGRGLAWLLLGNALTWWLSALIANGNLDGYGDMLESFAWGQQWVWSTFKHPPFTGWYSHLWFTFIPRSDATYYLLSCLNTALAVWGVTWLAREWLDVRQRWLAALFLLWALPYSTLAFKFNVNTSLLLLWPWMTFCCVRSLRHGSWSATLGLGLLGALAMLAKYYSGVLLLSYFIAAVCTVSGRRWLRTPQPYVAGALFLVCLIPHALWLMHNDYATLEYISEQGDGHVGVEHLIRFALAPLGYWAIGWIAALVFCYEGPWWQRALRSWRLNGNDDLLFWVAILPWGITLLFGLSGFVGLSLPWAIPMGFAYSILWLRNANAPHKLDAAVTRLRTALPYYFSAVVLLGGFLYAYLQIRNHNDNYYLPRKEVAAEVMARWQQRHPDIKLGWVGGQWQENGLLPFYGDAAIIALPNVPDEFPATTIHITDWEKQGGAFLCADGPAAQPEGASVCRQPIEAWLKLHARSSTGEAIVVQRSGWRFPDPIAWRYWVYWYVP